MIGRLMRPLARLGRWVLFSRLGIGIVTGRFLIWFLCFLVWWRLTLLVGVSGLLSRCEGVECRDGLSVYLGITDSAD